MKPCPNCQATTCQIKAGLTESGSQPHQCQHCRRRYTPTPKMQGYDDAMRKQAVRMYGDGINYRRIGRLLGVDHVTVMNWVRACASQLPSTPPQPDIAAVIEVDELYTRIGPKRDKKTDSTSLP